MDNLELEFQKIHETFRPKIQRYLTRLLGELEAEDLTQEVFVRVSQALPTFRGEAQLSTWLYRIATHAAIDRLRSPSFKRLVPQSLADESMEPSEEEVDDRNICMGQKTPSVEQQFVRQEMNECILDYIQKLPEKYGAVLVLSEFEGLSNKDIADILGVTLDTVKIRLHRARAKLKEELRTHCEAYWLEDNEFVPDLKHTAAESQKPA